MTLQPSATFHLHSETATTGEESQPWFAMEASIISALSTIPRLAAFATSPSTVGNAGEGASREVQQMEESGRGVTLKMRQTWLRTVLVGLIGAGVVSLYPARSTVSPAWTIRIVDTAGNPLSGAFVRQVWKDYSVESASHEQDAHTDENGHVSFPERTIRSSWLARTFGVISNTVSFGVHASYGPSAYVLAYGHTVGGKRHEGSANYQAGEPLGAKLVTRVSDLHLQ